MTPTTNSPVTVPILLDIGLAVLAAMIAVIIAVIVIGPAARQLDYPITYSGDALSHGLLIKSIVDTGWYFELSRVGAPFSASFLSYPIDEGFHLLLLKVFATLTGSYAASFNLFYLASFGSVAAVSYPVLRFLGISMPPAVAGAVTYAIIPYHFLRLEHLFLASYVAIPIAVGLAYWSWLRGVGKLSAVSGARRAVLIIGAIIVGSAGIYYAAFACALLLTSAVSASFSRNSLRALVPATGWICVIGIVIVLNVAPHLSHSLAPTAGTIATSTRSPTESELYALRPALLLLPTPSHRWGPLAAFGDRYTTVMQLVNENRTAALGTLGSLGLLVLLTVAWRRLAGNDKHTSDRDGWLATQALFTIAIGTFGGLGALFAFVISPALRGYNRISVVISFLATAMLLIAIERWVGPRLRGRFATIAPSLVAALIIIFAAWDQTSVASYANHVNIQSNWQSDAAFVSRVEATVEAEGSILIWPYLRFPERAPLHEEGYNGLLRLPLHAARSRWSYGAMAGSEADRWLSALSQVPIALVPNIAARSGMSGIVVARRALKDGGREADSVFSAMLGPAILSEDGAFAFYRLTKTGDRPLPTTSFSIIMAALITQTQYEAILHEGVSFAADEKNRAMVVSELKGFSGIEPWGRWTDASLADRGTIKLIRSLPLSGSLILRIRCFATNCNGKMRARYGGVEHAIDLRGISEQEVSLPMHADGGTEIELIPASPVSPRSAAGSTDDRVIGLGIMNMRWEKATSLSPSK